jgi:hypothetical protein
MSDEPGMPGVYLNMLCLLGDKGVKRVVKKPVTLAKKQRLKKHNSDLRLLIGELQPGMDMSDPWVLQCPVLNAEDLR